MQREGFESVADPVLVYFLEGDSNVFFFELRSPFSFCYFSLLSAKIYGAPCITVFRSGKCSAEIYRGLRVCLGIERVFGPLSQDCSQLPAVYGAENNFFFG